MGGNFDEVPSAILSLSIDFIPFVAPSTKAAYNSTAMRFIDYVSKRFITNSKGLVKFYSFPLGSIVLYFFGKYKDEK